MRPSVFNPGLMADFKRQAAKLDEQPAQPFQEHMALSADQDPAQGMTLFESRKTAELMPEPTGGYRSNLITFCIRCHVSGLDKRHDFRQMLAVEKAYFGINQMAFATGRQTGKSGQYMGSAREFLSNWLNYIDQAVSKGV